MQIKKWGGFLLRFIISAGLIYWLFSIVDLESTLQIIRKVDYSYIGLALLTFLVALVVFAGRWSILISSLGFASVPLSRLTKYYLIGLFFNNFLPTSIGGDIVRAYYLSHDINRKGESFASVVLERVLGFGITAIFSLIGIFFISGGINTTNLLYLILFLSVFVSFLAIFLLYEPLFYFVTRYFEKIRIFSIGEKLRQVFTAFRKFRDNPGALLRAIFLSALGQFLIILFNWLIFISISESISFYSFMFVVPLTMIASLFPSLNGIGTRETAYVVLLGALGVDQAPALALAIIIFFIPLMISISGGILYIFSNVSLRAVTWENNEEISK